jgi:hypothetical protein
MDSSLLCVLHRGRPGWDSNPGLLCIILRYASPRNKMLVLPGIPGPDIGGIIAALELAEKASSASLRAILRYASPQQDAAYLAFLGPTLVGS